MPHHHTAPTPAARESAAAHLRESVRALRELACVCVDPAALEALPVERAAQLLHEAGKIPESIDRSLMAPFVLWATTKADELESVADWLATPFGRCDECGEKLQHFVSENVGGVVCPDCDREFVEEVAEHAPLVGLEHRHPMTMCKICDRVRPFSDFAANPGKVVTKDGRTMYACKECWRQHGEECARCSHSRAAHDEQTTPTTCACCLAGAFYDVDPELPSIASAIADALRTRPVRR